jgi:hypothetical protein
MALPTSGQITLNQIHVEAGGASGTLASINDSDIRSLIGAASGQSNLSFSSFYGASAGFSTTMTVGSFSFKGATSKGFNIVTYGNLNPRAFGVAGIYNGFNITTLSQNQSLGVNFGITHNAGVAKANSGWSTIKINGITLNRSAASFTASVNESIWSWSNISLNFIYNNADGTTELVEFT